MYPGKRPDEVSLGESENSRGGDSECRAGVMTSCLLSQLSWQQPSADSNRGGAWYCWGAEAGEESLNVGPQYTPLRVFKLNKRCHTKDHSARRQHRSSPFRKAPSPTLSVTCFLSTPGSQGSVHHSPVSRCRKQGFCMPVCPWVWTQGQLHPTLSEKALKFISEETPWLLLHPLIHHSFRGAAATAAEQPDHDLLTSSAQHIPYQVTTSLKLLPASTAAEQQHRCSANTLRTGLTPAGTLSTA